MNTALAFLRYPDINPVLFHLGPIHVRWYGIAYLAGFALAYLLLRWMHRRKQLPISMLQLSDLLTWLILGVLVGGRMGWWIFYHHNIKGPEPWYEPIAIWHGGMSFHGGLTGVAIALLIWSRMNGVRFWPMADCLALVTPIGLFLGRIANFVNAELVGRPTSLPWGVIFPGDTIPRHPSQLYEAFLEGPLLMAVLWIIWHWAKPRPGRTALLFLIVYGVFRFAVEFTRQPDVQLGFIAWGWLTMGQLLSAVIFVIGVALWPFVGHEPRSAIEHSQQVKASEHSPTR